MRGHIYFHSPCFDGIVSAVLVSRFLSQAESWSDPELHPVNYEVREQWARMALPRHSAVVDFLFHPRAEFWADHHATTFLTEDLREAFMARSSIGKPKNGTLQSARFQAARRLEAPAPAAGLTAREVELGSEPSRNGFTLVRPSKQSWATDALRDGIWDPAIGSCSLLLWKQLFGDAAPGDEPFGKLAHWANVADSAQYPSVEEALMPTAPALRIAASLADNGTGDYCMWLVRTLAHETVEAISESEEVRSRLGRLRAGTLEGLARMKAAARLDDAGIATFDVETAGAFVSRYAPYAVFPAAHYSAGIVRGEKGTQIVTMRNPWIDFPSVHLGRLCEKLGGGGHQRVGAILVPPQRAAAAPEMLRQLVKLIRSGTPAENEVGGFVDDSTP